MIEFNTKEFEKIIKTHHKFNYSKTHKSYGEVEKWVVLLIDGKYYEFGFCEFEGEIWSENDKVYGYEVEPFTKIEWRRKYD